MKNIYKVGFVAGKKLEVKTGLARARWSCCPPAGKGIILCEVKVDLKFVGNMAV